MTRVYVSSFVIDLEEKEVLLIHNPESNQLIQPGGLMEEDESPIDSAIRFVKEKTGIDTEVLNTIFDQYYLTPVDVKEFKYNSENVLDIQYMAKPLNKELPSDNPNNAVWVNIRDLTKLANVDDEIKYKVYTLYKLFKNDEKKKRKR